MDTASHHTWHHLHADEVLQLLEVDLKTGLAENDVRHRREKFGRNRISPKAGPPGWLRFLRQFHQPLVYLLLAAVGITAFLNEWVDAGVILSVILINAVIGFFQEGKAADAINALSRTVATETTVRRGGGKQRIPSEELVPGDIVLLEPGDRVGADLRLFRLENLQVDESSLTGESVPVLKHVDSLALETVLADRKNLAFAGTLVTAGHAEGVVWAIGDKTETGRIAWLISETVEFSTPLTKKIAHFSRLLLWMVLALAGAMFGVGVASGKSAVDMFMTAVALSVGAIPEGLPAAVTVVLAIGVNRMARRRAIIRQLPAVETLGSTTVICTDKTGTLTQNAMTVREIYAGGELYSVSGAGHGAAGDISLGGLTIESSAHLALAECLRAGVLCNDAQVTRTGNEVAVQGDPTEIALIVAGEKGGIGHANVRRTSPLIDAIPFESTHMFRATLHDAHVGRVIYKVGAAERIIDRCSDTLDREGKNIPLDRATARHVVTAMAGRGLRVLALARRHVARAHARLEHGHVAEGLTLLGLVGMIDAPRPEAAAAVRRCLNAGIEVKMITGDHLLTARAIAQQVGLKRLHSTCEVVALSGRDLDKYSAENLEDVVERTTVFARVTPEQKLRLVCALQSRGHVVAMTGDGVNDAPALKQADIGVAMGISGTEVAKGSADMVLADDNFASIEAAVEEGRGVFDNLTKFIVWIIPTNLGEAVMLIIATAIGLPLPALPLQLLWINLTDTVLGLPLAFEPKEDNVMRRPPRNPRAPFLTRSLLRRTGLVTLLMVTGTLWLFTWEMNRAGANLATARTSVANAIVLVETFYLFNCRSLTRPCFSAGFFANRWVMVGGLTMLGAQLLFTYSPLMNRLFHSAPIDVGSWIRITGIAATVFAVVEFEKWLRHCRIRSERALPE